MLIYNHLKYTLFSFLISTAACGHATIDQLYHKINSKPYPTLSDKITTVSAFFLNKPYELGALGEGTQGEYDQFPLYRTDAFDCETYVDTVLALSFANNSSTFEHAINQIRYKNGQVSFITRNHFTCLDWNQNNQSQGFLRDITKKITNNTLNANALIDKPGWYEHMTVANIRLNNATDAAKRHQLQLLKQEGSALPKTMCTMPYIPFSALFNAQGQANNELFKQIPNASIIEIVRPNWDLEQQIGTHLNVSHLGFAIWKNNVLYFRQASSTQHRVVDTQLIEYLQAVRKNPTIQGIHIEQVLNQQ